jgi:hypothetical protein
LVFPLRLLKIFPSATAVRMVLCGIHAVCGSAFSIRNTLLSGISGSFLRLRSALRVSAVTASAMAFVVVICCSFPWLFWLERLERQPGPKPLTVQIDGALISLTQVEQLRTHLRPRLRVLV